MGASTRSVSYTSQTHQNTNPAPRSPQQNGERLETRVNLEPISAMGPGPQQLYSVNPSVTTPEPLITATEYELSPDQSNTFNPVTPDVFKDNRYHAIVNNSNIPQGMDGINETLSSLGNKLRDGFTVNLSVTPQITPSTNDLKLLHRLNVQLYRTITSHGGGIRTITQMLDQPTRTNIIKALHATGMATPRANFAALGAGNPKIEAENTRSTYTGPSPDMRSMADNINTYLQTKILPFMLSVAAGDVTEQKLMDEMKNFVQAFSNIYSLDDTGPELSYDFSTSVRSVGVYSEQTGKVEVQQTYKEKILKSDVTAVVEVFTSLGHELIHRFQHQHKLKLADGTIEPERSDYAMLQWAASKGSGHPGPNGSSLLKYMYRAAECEREAYSAQRLWITDLYDAFGQSRQDYKIVHLTKTENDVFSDRWDVTPPGSSIPTGGNLL